MLVSAPAGFGIVRNSRRTACTNSFGTGAGRKLGPASAARGCEGAGGGGGMVDSRGESQRGFLRRRSGLTSVNSARRAAG